MEGKYSCILLLGLAASRRKLHVLCLRRRFLLDEHTERELLLFIDVQDPPVTKDKTHPYDNKRAGDRE